jgi:hypothetical protein
MQGELDCGWLVMASWRNPLPGVRNVDSPTLRRIFESIEKWSGTLLLHAPELVAALEKIALAANAGDPDNLANAINESVDILCKAKGC